jgi:hypothetical protein
MSSVRYTGRSTLSITNDGPSDFDAQGVPPGSEACYCTGHAPNHGAKHYRAFDN